MADIFPRQGGLFRRLYDLKRWDGRTVVGWIEDDAHHFGVTIEHDGTTITDVRTASPRYPWTTCCNAGEPLRELIGKPLVSRASDIGKLVEMRLQCTHMFDLAGLVLAHAAHGREHRRYELAVPDREVLGRHTSGRPQFGAHRCTVHQDGLLVLWWDVQDDTITAPAEFAGQSLQRGFREFTERMPEEQAEHATLLRRAIHISSTRMMDQDREFTRAGDIQPAGVCYTNQPAQRFEAWHVKNSHRNYAAGTDGMLSHVNEKP